MDGNAAHGDRQGFPLEALPAAVGAGMLAHAVFQFPAHGVRLGLTVPSLQIVADPFKGLMENPLPTGLVVVQSQFFALGAVEDHVNHLFGQFSHGGGQAKMIPPGEGVEIHPRDAVALDVVPAGGGDGAVQDGEGGIGYHQVRVHLELAAEPCTGGAGSVRVVEGEHPGGELLDGDPAVLAGVVLGEENVPVLSHHVDDDDAARERSGRFHRIGKAADDVLPHDQTVDNDFDIMLFIFVQLDFFGELVKASVHPAAHITRFARVLEHLGVLALAGAHHRGKNLNACALGEHHHLVNDLVNGLLLDLPAAFRAVGSAHPRPKEP
ncbi:hypothetical protein SDC9_56547 [bioreactor metagenome]|uniref:Uncharacterized protein n=1 Tax=bioreactor metagenome TaxID=1076179 RepID=A0A644X2B1_9ZZZZ